MKRWFSIVLNFIYFLAVTGVVVKGHYCCNTTTLLIFEEVDNCCINHTIHKCNSLEQEYTGSQKNCEKTDGCCDGTSEIKKVTDWQAKTDFFQFSPTILTTSHICVHCFYPQNLEKQAEIPKYSFPPPRGIPLYKLHGDFRFYG